MKCHELDVYLKKLPDGVASYPEMQIKGALFRFLIRDGDATKFVPYLPEELHLLVLDPPPNNVWIPTVHFCAVEQLVRHQWYSDAESYRKYCYDGNMKSMTGSLYKFAVGMLSLERITNLATLAWPMTHKGSSVRVRKTEKGLMTTLTFPPNAFPPSMFDSFAMGFLALARLKGKENAQVDALPAEETEASFLIYW